MGNELFSYGDPQNEEIVPGKVVSRIAEGTRLGGLLGVDISMEEGREDGLRTMLAKRKGPARQCNVYRMKSCLDSKRQNQRTCQSRATMPTPPARTLREDLSYCCAPKVPEAATCAGYVLGWSNK